MKATEMMGAFARPELLKEALTHRSARRAKNNERLEFFGDRVLGMLMVEWLMERFPDEAEGDLGRRYHTLVAKPSLAQIADKIGLGAMLEVAAGEARSGVRRRDTVLADALEAVVGAVYLDGGLERARRFVKLAFADAVTGQITPPKDSKTALQEWAQARGTAVTYAASQHGPPHTPVFTVTASIPGLCRTTAQAGNKREAEQIAAGRLLRAIPGGLRPQPRHS